ncbi:poly(ADP-ribose) glycohydrolase [Acrasis kona]|uniref:poly(ADP-ribose) glycohydrolase n=1 Tax=Acrasis kona TaxID=1008807 RepID=A0AAW2YN08_9EUKA
MSKNHFLLPCSPINFHQKPSWEDIAEILTQAEVKKIDDLLEMVSDASLVDKEELGYLEGFFKDHTDEKLQNDFIHRTIPDLISMALKLPELFPDGHIPRLSREQEQTILLSREQIGSLLANMFFGTMNKMSWSPYWVQFVDVWYKAPTSSTVPKPVVAYLHSLLDYFKKLTTGRIDFSEKVGFHRQSKSSVDSANLSTDHTLAFSNVNVNNNERIGDNAEVEVDFANKDIGFGKTGTQEEILFGMNPEMCVAMLFCSTMQDDESVVISNVLRTGEYSGYGNTLQYVGPCEQSRCRTIVAIDAMELDYFENKKEGLLLQLNEKALLRDLNKALCGFDLVCKVKTTDTVVLGTGFWGCGAFGGDVYIKFCLQLLAVSQVDGISKMNFYTFGNSCFYEKAVEFMEKLKANKITVSELWSLISDYRDYVINADGEAINLFEFITTR